MATVASLDVNLGLRSREFTRSLNRAQRTVGQFGRNIEQTFRRIGQVTAGLAVSLAAVSNASLRAADEVAKSARNAGLSADSFQRLAESFRLGGSSANALVRGNQSLLRNIRDLGRGLSTQSEAFRSLGLSYRDLRDLAPEEQFLLTRQRLSELTNTTTQSAIAQQLFGRAGKEFGSILTANNATIRTQGDRLARLGGIIDESLLGTTEALVDQMETTSVVIRTQFTNALLEAATTAGGFQDLDDIITQIGQAVNQTAKAVFEFVLTIVEWRNEIGAVIGAWIALRAVMFASAAITAIAALSSAIGTLIISIRTYNFAIVAARVATIAFYAALLAIPVAVGAIGIAIYSARDAIVQGFGAAIDFAVAKFGQFRARAANVFLGIESFIVKVGGIIQEFLIDRFNDVLGVINRVQEFLGRDPIELISNEAAANATKRLAEIESQIMANVVAQQMLGAAADAAATQVVNSAQAAVQAGVMGVVGFVQGALSSVGIGGTEMPMAAVAGQEDPSVAAGDMGEASVVSFWDRITESFNREIDSKIPELGTSLSANFSQAISMGNFEDLGDILTNTIQTNIQGRVQERLNEVFSTFFDGFFDMISSGLMSGGGGGGLGGLLSAGLGLFGFAEGGVVPGPRNGSEAVPAILHSGEVVLNAGQQRDLLNGGGGGGQAVTQNINVTGDVTEATRRAVRDMGNDITSMVQQGFNERGLINA